MNKCTQSMTQITRPRLNHPSLGWSMTNMQAAESKSHPVFNAYLSLTMVNDKNAETYDESSLLRAVNDNYAFSQ